MTNLFTIRAGNAELVLAPEMGGAVMSWTRDGKPMFRPPGEHPESPRDLASYPLVPFSNRVAKRQFQFAGKIYHLPDLMRGQAIHGAGWQLPWTAQQDGTRATLHLDYPGGDLWPFPFRSEQIFTLTEDALVTEISITNLHNTPVPAGIGQHPYFPRSAGARLNFHAGHVWQHNDDKIPVHRSELGEWNHSEFQPVGPLDLDHCFGAWDGKATLSYPDLGYTLTITADPIFTHLIVFVPQGQSFFAVEPVSNMNDGLNRMEAEPDHGVFILAPGEKRLGMMTFRIGPV